MQKRRCLFLILIGVGVLAGVFAVVFRSQPEPEYGGKKLSEWVDGISSLHRVEADIQLSADAVGHMGVKNSLPYLLKWLSYDTPAWQVKLFALVNPVLSRVWPSWKISAEAKELRAAGAGRLMVRLGSQAEPALRELRRLVNDRKGKASASRAEIVLGYVGQAALPDLIAGLTNQNEGLRGFYAVRIRCLVTNGSQARPPLPALLQCLHDTNEIVVVNAVLVLGELKTEPNLVVPALANSLHDSRVAVRHAAAQALGEFGRSARPAGPALMNLLSNPVPRVRVAATNALRKIDPQALETTTAQ